MLKIRKAGSVLFSVARSGNVVQRRGGTNHTADLKAYFEKNVKLKRPVAPFMIGTHYKPQLTSILSITGRIAGIGMGIVVPTFGCLMLASKRPLYDYIEMVRSFNLPRPLIWAGQACVAWPLGYHYINGIRHLSWDAGKGYNLKFLYKTGWTALGTSIVLTLFLVSLKVEPKTKEEWMKK